MCAPFTPQTLVFKFKKYVFQKIKKNKHCLLCHTFTKTSVKQILSLMKAQCAINRNRLEYYQILLNIMFVNDTNTHLIKHQTIWCIDRLK